MHGKTTFKPLAQRGLFLCSCCRVVFDTVQLFSFCNTLFFKVKIILQAKPELWRITKILRQAQRCICGDTSRFFNNSRDTRLRQAGIFCQPVGGDT